MRTRWLQPPILINHVQKYYHVAVTAYDPNDSTYEITYDDEDTESSVHEARIVQGVKDFSEQTTGPPADTIEANTNEPATTIA